MTTTHIQASQWGEYQWRHMVKHVRASSDGAVGVLFVWTEPNVRYDQAPPAFVVKPVTGGASTKFAEKVLAKVAGAASPDSRVLAATSEGGKGVLWWVRNLVSVGKLSADRAAAYRAADSFLVQKAMGGYQELSAAYRAGPKALIHLLRREPLMRNLGRLAAADLILGNGDRVERSNFGNIMFDARGQVAAIDSAALLGSFDQLLKYTTMTQHLGPNALPHPMGATGEAATAHYRNEWVVSAAMDGSATPSDKQIPAVQAWVQDTTKPLPVLAPMAKMAAVQAGQHGLLFDNMRFEWEARIKAAAGTATPIDRPSAVVWAIARKEFVRGFEAGLLAIDTLLGGLATFRRGVFASSAWKGLKEEYKTIGYSGVDPNLSWFNLVVRREMYLHLRRGKTMAEAIAAGQALAARKHGKMLAKGRVG